MRLIFAGFLAIVSRMTVRFTTQIVEGFRVRQKMLELFRYSKCVTTRAMETYVYCGMVLWWVSCEREDERRICEVLSFADDAMQISVCAKIASSERRDRCYMEPVFLQFVFPFLGDENGCNGWCMITSFM